MLRTAIIIPAYNEGTRLAAVLATIVRLPAEWEVIVVDDGSHDNTAEIARRFPRIEVLRLSVNQGKGAAMCAGVALTQADVLVFLDADLRGLQPEHVQNLVAPVAAGSAEMSVGVFRGGRGSTDFSHVIAPWVSGQRAIRRELFLSLNAAGASRQGIELLLTRAARERGWRVIFLPWRGVTHAMKEEKLGLIAGHVARWRMYREILQTWFTEVLRPAPAPEVPTRKSPVTAPRRK